jgi:hypothetical protein
MVRAAEVEEEDGDGVLTLLDKREMWLAERSVEEREWVGPDPGISTLRESVEIHGLGISAEDLRRWMLHQLGETSQLHTTRDEGVWMLRLDDDIVQELSNHSKDVMRIDMDTVGWSTLIQAAADRTGPHWFHVVFDREIARSEPAHIFLSPHHPLIRLLCERQDEGDTLGLRANRNQTTPPQAAWCVCIDWTVDSLTRTTVRRWLHLDAEGLPVEDPRSEPLNSLRDGIEDPSSLEVKPLLAPIEAALLEGERSRLLPLLEELRANAEQAWHARISRELGQLAEADWRSRNEGQPPDPRWVRMKNGLITRLQDDLAKRLAELDRMSESLTGRLDLRIAIRLE